MRHLARQGVSESKYFPTCANGLIFFTLHLGGFVILLGLTSVLPPLPKPPVSAAFPPSPSLCQSPTILPHRLLLLSVLQDAAWPKRRPVHNPLCCAKRLRANIYIQEKQQHSSDLGPRCTDQSGFISSLRYNTQGKNKKPRAEKHTR